MALEGRLRGFLLQSLRHCSNVQVARGRKKSEAEVSELAKGRVWLGSTALELGLVDKLGGEKEAVHLAKLEAGLPTEVCWNCISNSDLPGADAGVQLPLPASEVD